MDAHRAEVKARRDAQILAHAEAMAAGGEEGMEISQGINNLLGVSEQLMADGTKLFAEGSMDKLQNDVQVNVGTIGHVDHGVTQVVHALERAADDYGQAALAGVEIEIDPADPDPASTRAFIEQELVSQRSLTPDPVAYERQAGASADLPEAYLTQERPAHEFDRLLVDPDPATSFLLDASAEVVRRHATPHYCGTNDPSVLAEEVRTPQYPRVESEEGTHYPELQGKSREQLDAHFGDRVVSDAELLAADPKGGL
jgi:hypothetical protein